MIKFFKSLFQRSKGGRRSGRVCQEHHIGYTVGIKDGDQYKPVYFYKNLSEVSNSHPTLKRSSLYKFFRNNQSAEATYLKSNYSVAREYEEIC
jgi:hypothetical protein